MLNKYYTEEVDGSTIIKNSNGVTLARCFKKSFAEDAVNLLNEFEEEFNNSVVGVEDKSKKEDLKVSTVSVNEDEEYDVGVASADVEQPIEVKESSVPNKQ